MKKNEEMLVISAGGRDGGHQCGVLCDHDLDDLLEFGIPDRSPTRPQLYPDSSSVILVELWDCLYDLPVSYPAASEEQQVGANARTKIAR